MFEDISAKEVIGAINDLIDEDNLRKTTYQVWFGESRISPAEVITKVHESKGNPIGRRSFSTGDAQRRLLQLGFPIYDDSRDDYFFTKSDLVSFTEIVKRKSYNSSDTIDQNIGKWLNYVAWEKSKIWKDNLKEKGWDVKGGKHWNTQSRSHSGQGLKDYTWYRIYPKKRSSDLICFTIGIHADDSLVYKLDCKRSDSFFTEEKWYQFEALRKKAESEWQYVHSDDLFNKDWDSLGTETHKYFESQLPAFYEIERELLRDNDRRIMRLTWNKKNWEKPSGHKWSEKNQGNTTIAYENQYGYGHEEWLFNHRYQKKGFQYGYVRGVERMSEDAEVIDELVLYSINPQNKERYLVAKLLDVTIIEGTDEADQIVVPLVEKYKDTAMEELRSVKAHVKSYQRNQMIPNVKFLWDNVLIFNEPIPAPYLSGRKYNRFIPYSLDNLDRSVSDKLKEQLNRVLELVFNSGRASTTDSYSKKTKGGESNVNRKHTPLTNNLYDYFHKIKGISEDRLSEERTRVGGAIVDLAVKTDAGLILFEAKTSSSGLQNIRQALGQLLEYAFLDESANIKELVIVGPAKLKEHEIGYLNRIRAMLNVPLNYWAYIEENKLEDRFLES